MKRIILLVFVGVTFARNACAMRTADFDAKPIKNRILYCIKKHDSDFLKEMLEETNGESSEVVKDYFLIEAAKAWKTGYEAGGMWVESSTDRLIEILLPHISNINFQNKRTGDTALHYVAEKGDYEAVCVLLENGANPNVKNRSRKSPLDLVMSRLRVAVFSDMLFQDIKVIEKLIEYNATKSKFFFRELKKTLKENKRDLRKCLVRYNKNRARLDYPTIGHKNNQIIERKINRHYQLDIALRKLF